MNSAASFRTTTMSDGGDQRPVPASLVQLRQRFSPSCL